MTADELDAVHDEADRAGIPMIAHAIGQRGAVMAVRAGARLLAHTPLVDSVTAAWFADRNVCVAFTLSSVADGVQKAAASESLLRLRRSGVRIMIGTDAGVVPHGTNASELLALQQIGFPAADVLRSATTVAAACRNTGLAPDRRHADRMLSNGTSRSAATAAGAPTAR